MKKWIPFLFICVFTNSFPQTNISPQFAELKGMEDQQENTHLFYRIYNVVTDEYSTVKFMSVYHLDIDDNTDSLFLTDYIKYSSYTGSDEFIVGDIDFWNRTPNYFIAGGSRGLDGVPFTYFQRFDNEWMFMIPYIFGRFQKIEISDDNDSLIYGGVGGVAGVETTIKSTDGGWNWEEISNEYMFESFFPNQHAELFATDGPYAKLYKSTDSGLNYYLVDTSSYFEENIFQYDSDRLHIYRLAEDHWRENYLLRVSDNKGEVDSWETKFYNNSKTFISTDESISGTIYISNRKDIYISRDYGDNFNLYKSLSSNIVGIYKKPTSNKLYAATEYKIYEISSDTIRVIKWLPAVEDFEWYPLSIGNLWVYENYFYEDGLPQFIGYSWDIITDTVTLINSKKYYEILRRQANSNLDTLYLRLDSLSSKIYGYDRISESDLFYEDLAAELGDTICYAYDPYWYCQEVQSEDNFSIWGLSTKKREIYPDEFGWICSHSLVKGIGLFNYGCGDLVGFYSNLIGCVIDGLVYGDTTVVSVDDEEPNIPYSFKLEQNYPNPFNPTTKIKFTIPPQQNPLLRGDYRGGLVTLKVYDVLGNQIATLVNEQKPAGNYEVIFDATGLPSGIYFYGLTAGNYSSTKKMILLK